jgi:hypothetical protein
MECLEGRESTKAYLHGGTDKNHLTASVHARIYWWEKYLFQCSYNPKILKDYWLTH